MRWPAAFLVPVVLMGVAGCGGDDSTQTRTGNRAAGIEHSGPQAVGSCDVLQAIALNMPEIRRIGGDQLETALAQRESALYSGRAFALRASEIARDHPATVVNIEGETLTAADYLRRLARQLRPCPGIAEVVARG